MIRSQNWFIFCFLTVLLFCLCGILYLVFFGEGQVFLRSLDQFLSNSLRVLGEGKKPNPCGNVQYMPLFDIFGWSIILASLTRFL